MVSPRLYPPTLPPTLSVTSIEEVTTDIKDGPSLPSHKDGVRAATAFCRLMERQLGQTNGSIDSNALRLFFKAYWHRVSVLAHTMHDAEEE